MILALDPATRCGFALGSAGAIIASGTWDLSVRRDESAGMRVVRFRAKLREVLGQGVDLVVFEAARNRGPKMQGALVVQAELQGVLKLTLEEARIDYRGYSPSEIKKHATRKGNANKAAMLAAARAKWPAFSGDDNEADARWLADLAMKERGGGSGNETHTSRIVLARCALLRVAPTTMAQRRESIWATMPLV